MLANIYTAFKTGRILDRYLAFHYVGPSINMADVSGVIFACYTCN